MTTRTKALLGILGVCVAAGGAMLWANRPPPPNKLSPFVVPENVKQAHGGAPPVIIDAPKFAMTDQDGQPTGNAQLKGKVWIADFIFTHCAGSCPRVTGKFVELQKAINDPDIRFVSFSVDPDRDDPKTLKQYGTDHNAGDNRWMLLRPADREAILHVAQGMSAVTPSHDAHDSILHTDFFILIDPAGKVRGLYDSKNEEHIERLKTDAAVLSAQRMIEKNPKRAAT